jgi:diacylglycerol kinase (ATP)
MHQQPFSIRNRIKSFSFAFQGLKTFFQTQHNAWIHVFATIIVIISGNIVGLSSSEWLWISLAIAFVFITEMLNTAIEFLTDLVSPEYHLLAKKTKDVAAGAVLVSAIFAVGIGIFVFLPRIFN